MHAYCTTLHIRIPIKAVLEKVSGHSPLEGISTPFPTGTTDCVQDDSFHPGPGLQGTGYPSPGNVNAFQAVFLSIPTRHTLSL